MRRLIGTGVTVKQPKCTEPNCQETEKRQADRPRVGYSAVCLDTF